MADAARLQQVVDDYYGNLPHPLAPEIKVKEYPAFEHVAALLKDSKPEPQDVRQAHANLKGAGVSPQQFDRSWRIARPLANRLLGRDPRMDELAHLADAHPADYHDYYHHMPHPQFPEVKAGDMVRYMHAATPIARRHIGRDPLPVEVARFAAAGYGSEDMMEHYKP